MSTSKTKKKISALKKAVDELLTDQSKKNYTRVINEYGLSKFYKNPYQSLQNIYQKYIRAKCDYRSIDCRVRSGKYVGVKFKFKSKTTAKMKRVNHYPMRELTTEQQLLLFSELLESTSRIIDFLDVHKISYRQYYKIRNQLRDTGKIGDRRIFNNKKYGTTFMNDRWAFNRWILYYRRQAKVGVQATYEQCLRHCRTYKVSRINKTAEKRLFNCMYKTFYKKSKIKNTAAGVITSATPIAKRGRKPKAAKTK